MPPAIEYASDLTSPAHRDQVALADKEFQARQKLCESHAAYYLGLQKKPLKVKQNEPDDNIILNYSAQTINNTISFAVPDLPMIEMESGADESPDEAAIREWWEAIGGASFIQSAMLFGSTSGHPFAYVWLPEGSNIPRCVLIPPESVIVFWDEDDRDKVLWYERRWEAGGKKYRQDIISEGVNWTIRQFVMNNNQWVADRQMPDAIWPYPLPPILDWQHLPKNDYYGQHEFTGMDLQDQINAVASNMNRILRFHAQPRTIGTGFANEQLKADASIGSFWTIPAENAKIFNLEMQSDLVSSLNFLQLLTDNFYKENRVVSLPSDPRLFSNMTNMAVRATFMQQLTKTETLHRQYDKFVIGVTRRVLMLMGKPFDVPIKTEWGNALPVNQVEETQLAQSQINMGVLSKEGAANKLGIDWKVEKERLENEAEQAGAALERFLIGPPQAEDNGQPFANAA